MLQAPGAELCQNTCGVVNKQKIFCSPQCFPECSMVKFRAYIHIYIFIYIVFTKWHHQTIRKNKEVSACISYYNDIVLKHCPILVKWQEFLPLKIFLGLLTQWFWYSFKLLSLFNRFLHAQKIIIFIVVFWKHNCKYLFIFIY